MLQGSPQQAPVQQRGYLQEYLTSSRLLASHLNAKLDALRNDHRGDGLRIKQLLPVPCVHAAGITVQLQASVSQSAVASGLAATVRDWTRLDKTGKDGSVAAKLVHNSVPCYM